MGRRIRDLHGGYPPKMRNGIASWAHEGNEPRLGGLWWSVELILQESLLRICLKGKTKLCLLFRWRRRFGMSQRTWERRERQGIGVHVALGFSRLHGAMESRGKMHEGKGSSFIHLLLTWFEVEHYGIADDVVTNLRNDGGHETKVACKINNRCQEHYSMCLT